VRVVILGATGNFGRRIALALQSESAIVLIAASRRGGDAASTARMSWAKLDIDNPDFPAALSALRPELVIHCVGPFQGQDYRVARATLQASAHYLDLADGRAFVAGFAKANDAEAVAADRLALSGASTLPALSAAVVDALSSRLDSLTSIEIAIAPAQRAPRGAATLEGVFGYLGKPFFWLREGRWVKAYGWQELERVVFDFGARWAAACDVPDLELLPQRYRSVRSVQFRAALELSVEHYALWFAAALRRAGMPLPMERWAVPLDRLASRLDRFGSACGGMLVTVGGVDAAGALRRLTWHITAPDNHGPEIPCMAAILLTRRIVRGEIRARGAHACMGFLTLADFEPELARWSMHTRIEEAPG
jgi:saccharopine dehydrogenase-like NADP-dependent oxidoreductase